MVAEKGRGALIVLEGCDRSGKSTQVSLEASRLMEWLGTSGREAELLKFPNRQSPVTGRLIDEYLRSKTELPDETIHLLFSANRWEDAPRMRQALQDGKTLIVDRYAHSGVAFSWAKGRAGMGLEWCRGPDVGLPRPDLVLFLDLDSEAARLRDGFGQERYERQPFQEKVRTAFHSLGEAEPKGVWRSVDASRSLDEVWQVTAEVRAAVEEAIRAARDRPIEKLWLE